MTGLKVAPTAGSLVALVKEWRDARQAFFDTHMSQRATANAGPMYIRLSNAEHALMHFARQLGPDGIALTSAAHDQS